MREAAEVAPPDLARDPDSVTAVFPTGGTTGLSKGAIWTHRTWQTMIANLLTAFPVQRPPVNLVVAPMTHAAGGVALMLMAAGATFVILPGFSPERVPAAIEQYRVTHLFLPPTAIYMLLAHPEVRDHDYSSLDYLIYAAAPMSVDKLRVAMEVFGPVMALIPFDDDDDAVRFANDSNYGLGGSVWSADEDRALAVARRVRTGTIGLNYYTLDLGAPFGGYKDSGIGRELGPEGINAYLEYKSVYASTKYLPA
jgi:acyl-CoA synthetase (AMP-forming)/AMP-acid ligase II